MKFKYADIDIIAKNWHKLTMFLLLLPGLAFAQTSTKPKLPNPTGKFGIGRTAFHWTDKSRPEITTDEAGDFRELLVYLFYPVDKNHTGEKAVYFPHLKETETFEERFGEDFFRSQYGESYKLLADMQTHTIENAEISAKKRRYPVVVFSHGGGIPVLFYTVIIEELVSHGYVVAAVEHSYDGATVVFPDGRIITQSGWENDAERTPQEQAAFHMSRIRVGAEDDGFVLSQLEKIDKGKLPEASKRFKGKLDTSRAGAFGHSFGGKVASLACGLNKRFKFCLNLDGGLDAGENYGSITQPIAAMFGYRKSVQKSNETEADFLKRRNSMENFIQNLEAEYSGAPSASRFILIDSPGFSHFSYYDLPNVQAEDPPWNATPEQWSRNKQIINAFTVAAFDKRLRSKQPESLNSLPIAQYPEVALDTLGTWKKSASSWRFERTVGR